MTKIKKYWSKINYLLDRKITKKSRGRARSITTSGTRKEKKKERRLCNKLKQKKNIYLEKWAGSSQRSALYSLKLILITVKTQSFIQLLRDIAGIPWSSFCGGFSLLSYFGDSYRDSCSKTKYQIKETFSPEFFALSRQKSIIRTQRVTKNTLVFWTEA